MSWLVGSFTETEERIRECCPDAPLVSIKHKGLVIYAGGNPRTCKHGLLATGEAYIVLGYPLYLHGDKYIPLCDAKLRELIMQDDMQQKLDGHWLIMLVKEDRIRIINDSLGKRSLYISTQQKASLFTTSLAILKSVVNPELDFRKTGAMWHTMFPASNDRYSPSHRCSYYNTEMLSPGSVAVITRTRFEVSQSQFLPDSNKRDIISLLSSCCLAPLNDTTRLAIGLSGGMDIRPLLAIYLGSGVKVSAIYYGNDDTEDYRIGKQMATDLGFEHHHISFESAESADPWQQAVNYMYSRGISANPIDAPYFGLYRQVAESFDTYVSGYFGELYRFRFYVAHLLSIFKGKQRNPADLSAYLYRIPPSIFKPEYARMLHEGYVEDLRYAFASMPATIGKPNPFWYDLFLARYAPMSVVSGTLAAMDEILLDHMPWLQRGIISQHWHNSFAYQLGEGIHRRAVSQFYPTLEKYPLSMLHVRAPYYYRQYMVKLKMWKFYRNRPMTRESRSERFLNRNKENILDLFLSRKVQEYHPYDTAKIDKALNAFYNGDKSAISTILCWLGFELGR